jgi:4-carboxymuconolactone decarboxylase
MLLALCAVAPARAGASGRDVTVADIQAVSPALAQYTRDQILGQLWHRPGLTPRDRGIITVSALIARGEASGMRSAFALALDNGVTPAVLSGIVTHLAFYSGWGNAMAAVAVAKEIFAQRGIGADQLPQASPALLPGDPAAEALRKASVDRALGTAVPGLVQFTTDTVFNDLWLRPDLAPRDRSLVTISALIASGQTAQLASHLNRAMNNGLTRAEIGETVTHLAFYAGWPNAFSAAAIVKAVFDKRPD